MPNNYHEQAHNAGEKLVICEITYDEMLLLIEELVADYGEDEREEIETLVAQAMLATARDIKG